MIIIRYSEIALKGKNRGSFENLLIHNIRECLSRNNLDSRVSKIKGRIFTDAPKEALKYLKNVFGIVSLSYAEECADFSNLKEKISLIVQNKKFESFVVRCNRLDKNYPKTSVQIEQELGEYVFEKFHKKVDLKNPELTIGIEISDKIYLFSDKINGFGGLPLNPENKIAVFVSLKEDAVAALLMMKRGCIANIYYADKKPEIISKFDYGFPAEYIKVKDFQEIDENIIAVADTLDDLKDYSDEKLILRPLIAYNKNDINKLYTLFENEIDN
jgi:thiamine biosynthesis protein ThiI